MNRNQKSAKKRGIKMNDHRSIPHHYANHHKSGHSGSHRHHAADMRAEQSGQVHHRGHGKTSGRKKRNLAVPAALVLTAIAFLVIILNAPQGKEADKHANQNIIPADDNIQETQGTRARQEPEGAAEIRSNAANSEYAAAYLHSTGGSERSMNLYFTKDAAAAEFENKKRVLIRNNEEEKQLECVKSEESEWLCAPVIKEDAIRTLLERKTGRGRWEKSITVKGRKAECFLQGTLMACYDSRGVLVYMKNNREQIEELTFEKELPFEQAEQAVRIPEKAGGEPPLPTGINDACSRCALLAGEEMEKCYDEC